MFEQNYRSMARIFNIEKKVLQEFIYGTHDIWKDRIVGGNLAAV